MGRLQPWLAVPTKNGAVKIGFTAVAMAVENEKLYRQTKFKFSHSHEAVGRVGCRKVERCRPLVIAIAG